MSWTRKRGENVGRRKLIKYPSESTDTFQSGSRWDMVMFNGWCKKFHSLGCIFGALPL